MTSMLAERPSTAFAEKRVAKAITVVTAEAQDVTSEVNAEFGRAHVALVRVAHKVPGVPVAAPTGTVTVSHRGVVVGSGTLVGGQAVVTWVSPGTTAVVAVTYTGDAVNLPVSCACTPVVLHPAPRAALRARAS